MKILMTSETFLPRMGGAEMHVWYLGEKLSQAGHQVTLLTNEPDSDQSVYRKVTPEVVRISWSRKNIPKIFRLLWNLSKDVDVIHSHYSYRLAALAGLVALLRRKPIIVTLHGMGTLDEPGAKFPYKQAHAVYRWLSLNLATRIIATSEDMARVAREHMINPHKITNIFNGVDIAIFNPTVTIPGELKNKYQNQKVILTVRRLVPKNGIHFLIETLPYLLKTTPNLKYIMIGTGRMEKYILERIEKLNLKSYVDVAGEMDNSLIPKYLALADVVVFPSTAESSSIACAEALAMGKTVVASRVGGLVELLGSNSERGYLTKLVSGEGSDYDAPIQLPVDRYEHFAEVIALALNSNGEKSAVALRFAKDELDWDVVALKTVGIYQLALNNGAERKN